MTPKLDKPPTRLRAPVSRSTKNRVEREGGRWGAGLIKRAAIVTRGEALGHEMWLDSEFLKSVVAGIEASYGGIKIRFTHPSLSDDGLGKFLGRIDNPELDGDVVRADIHFSETAHETPDGDLASYVMDLAEKHPADFGMSIVFERDEAAEAAFREQAGERSPDEDNRDNYKHARLKRLFGADVVDEPAANPYGLFHRDHIAHDAEALLSFGLGLTTELPQLTQLDIDPGRAAGFVKRFLDTRDLAIVPRGERKSAMSDPKPVDAPQPDPAPAPATEPAVEEEQPTEADQELARLSQLQQAFPDNPALVLSAFASGKTVGDAQAEFLKAEVSKLAEANKALTAQVADLTAKLAANSGPAPVKFGALAATPASNDFLSQGKALAAEKKIPLRQALSELAAADPALYAKSVGR